MVVIADKDGVRASYNGRTWSSDNESLERMVTSLTPVFDQEMVLEYLPYRSNSLAEWMAEKLGGQVISLEPVEPVDPGRVY